MPYKNNFFNSIIDRQSVSCNSISDIKKILNNL